MGSRVSVRFAAIALVATLASGAEGSDLLAGTVGAADTGMAAADLASPRSPAGAQFANPAGLAGFETSLSVGLGAAWGTGKVRATIPDGYDKDNSVVAIIPELAYVRRGKGGWSFAAGVNGTVGTRYDYEKKPSVDVDQDFFAEVTIVAAPLSLAYRAGERLWLGVQVMPVFGYFRSHFAIPPYTPGFDALFTPRFKLTGPGITAMGGVSWHATDQLSFALSARPPGRVWMDGSSVAPNGERQDTDLHLDLPAEVSVGATFKPAPTGRSRTRCVGSTRAFSANPRSASKRAPRTIFPSFPMPPTSGGTRSVRSGARGRLSRSGSARATRITSWAIAG